MSYVNVLILFLYILAHSSKFAKHDKTNPIFHSKAVKTRALCDVMQYLAHLFSYYYCLFLLFVY